MPSPPSPTGRFCGRPNARPIEACSLLDALVLLVAVAIQASATAAGCQEIVKSGKGGAPGASNAQVRFANGWILAQIRGRAAHRDPAVLQDVPPVGDLEGEHDVLLDQENRGAVRSEERRVGKGCSARW